MDVLWDVRCNSENLILCSGHQMTVAVAMGYPPVEQFEQRVVGLCAERFELWTNCWHRTINTCHGYKTNGLFDWNQFHVNKSKHIPFCYRHREGRCQGGRERNWGEVTFCDSIGQIALTLDWPNSWKHICHIWYIWNMIYMLYVLYMIIMKYDISVSELHQNKECIGKSILDAWQIQFLRQEISQLGKNVHTPEDGRV